PIALVGLSGTGKSSVAPVLARRLGLGFVDVDREVEASAGASAGEVFADRGEDAFRDLEAAALTDAGDAGPSVIATGGGAVLRPANRALLGRCRVVWLTAAPDVLVERLARSPQARPLLADDPGSALRRLAGERDPLYREVADLVVDVEGCSV